MFDVHYAGYLCTYDAKRSKQNCRIVKCLEAIKFGLDFGLKIGLIFGLKKINFFRFI